MDSTRSWCRNLQYPLNVKAMASGCRFPVFGCGGKENGAAVHGTPNFAIDTHPVTGTSPDEQQPIYRAAAQSQKQRARESECLEPGGTL